MSAQTKEGVVATNLVQAYSSGRRLWGKAEEFRAVDRVSLTLAEGETLGIVGESGSGKSTLGRMIAGIEAPSSGTVTFWGEHYAKVGTPEWRRQRRHVQVVFQNPAAVVDPRWSIHAQVREALTTHERLAPSEADDRAQAMLALVGLGSMGKRLPHQLSGGQLQRAVIARALVLNPRLVVCDEAVSALDVSVQAQIINMLLELRERLNLSLMFISHDLSVVRHISHRVGVMHAGELLEIGDSDTLFDNPRHEYTSRLLAAIPADSPRWRRWRGLSAGMAARRRQSPRGTTRTSGPVMKIIAHRGDSASFPENTPEGWHSAYANGAFAIEADVRLSQDGFCICAHDPDLRRLFERPERPEDLSLAELLGLRNASGGRIVVLADVLQHAKAGQNVLLDIKDETPRALEAIWATIIETVPGALRQHVIAGCHTLDAVRFFAAKAETGILGFIPAPDEAEAFFGAGASLIRLWERDVTADRVALFHALGAEVWVTAGGRATAYETGDTSSKNLAILAQSGVRGVLVNDVAAARGALETMR